MKLWQNITPLSMMKYQHAFALVLLTALSCQLIAAERPHIVVYLSDDHALFDTGLFGAADIPTLLDAAGEPPRPDLDGRSFLPVLLGAATAHRDRIFTTHSGDGIKNICPIRAVRDAEWKLIHNLRPDLAHTNHSDIDRKPGAGNHWGEWAALAKTDPAAQAILDRYYARPEFEFYHVAEDKWEQTNLINDPAHAGRIAEMKAELAAWMKQQRDTGQIFNKPRPLDQPETWHPDHFPHPSAPNRQLRKASQP